MPVKLKTQPLPPKTPEFPEAVVPETENSKGSIRIAAAALATIVRKAACSVNGVTRITGSSLVDNIAEFVGSRKVMDRAISIEMGENAVSIEIKVVLAFGCHIPDIAKNIQDTVIDEISRITGMQVPRIDIVVMDLEDEEDDDDEAEENVPETE